MRGRQTTPEEIARLTEVLRARDAVPSDKEIARELGMTVRQVKQRICWIRQKRAEMPTCQ